MIKITTSTGKARYKTVVKSMTNSIIVDEPLEEGGGDLGLKPGELLATSLASCTGITLRMYADRKGWDLEEVMIETTLDNSEKGKTKFTLNIRIFGNLDAQQREKLHEIAEKCPIHKMLENPIEVQTVLKD